jgi:hypothetical protein
MVLLLVVYKPAASTTFTAVISDQDGKPVANAVVNLLTDSGNTMPAPASVCLWKRLSTSAMKRSFHWSRSFEGRTHRLRQQRSDDSSGLFVLKIKQFEMTLNRGQTAPVTFENSGIAALGCNIHDHMIAYAFVAESPWTALTGEDGRSSPTCHLAITKCSLASKFPPAVRRRR